MPLRHFANLIIMASVASRLFVSVIKHSDCVIAALLYTYENQTNPYTGTIIMTNKLMILPAKDFKAIRVVRIPEDFEEQEAFRCVTSLIASVEENNPAYSWSEIAELLEDNGFEVVPFVLGPALD